MRRCTRLSNGSRKLGEPHGGGGDQLLRLHFIKMHRTLRVSPAMAAGVTMRLFT
jgi:hypothetical protein